MTHCNRPSLPQQRRLAKQVQNIDANHFFNLLSGRQLLEAVEAQLPEHRERQYPQTLTLAMFLGQVMSADGSCQNAANEALVNRLLSGMSVGSANTGSARKSLQLLMAITLQWTLSYANRCMNRNSPRTTGAAKTVVADCLLMKQQLLIMNRARRRAPNLTTLDRLLLGFYSLFLRPRHIQRAAVIIRTSTLLKYHHLLKQRKYRLLYASSRKGKPGPKGPSPELI